MADDASCFTAAGPDQVVGSVGIGALANSGGPTMTHALQLGSPAIDAVVGACAVTEDQRGVARPKDGNGDGTAVCDSGSFEVPAPGRLQFSAATYSTNESGPSATITVTRINGSKVAVGASVATSDGTATQPSDYGAVATTVSFGDGVTSQAFQVSIVNDTLDEPDETVNLTLSSPTGGATLGTPAAAVLTIIDDEATAGLSVNDVTVTEGNSGTVNAVFTVTLNPASGQTVTVVAQTADGTATAGSARIAATRTTSTRRGT